MKLHQRIISGFLLCAATMGASAQSTNHFNEPWMTGPLLAPAGEVVPAGHTNWEPYLFVTDRFARYGSHGHVRRTTPVHLVIPELVLTQGLYHRLDSELIVAYNFKRKGQNTYNDIDDLQLMLGFQAIQAKTSDWYPMLRMTLIETFPTGRYERLSPVMGTAQATGSGSYVTTFTLNFQKTIKFSNSFLRVRWYLTYAIPTSVRVHDFSTYGGGFGTNGTVKPGQVFTSDIGFEYTLTQHWVPALDIVYTAGQAQTFTGFVGRTAAGRLANVGSGSNSEWTLAPGLEYNFTQALGIIAGAWFSVQGRNVPDFRSAVVALNYYH